MLCIHKKPLKMASSSFFVRVCLHLLVIVIFSANAVLCGSVVEYLPGFDGKLPFKLETGYVTVKESELFYYFIETQGNPKVDPFLLWFSGGPGCSVLNALVFENGPLAFNITEYEGGLPSLELYPYSWTKTASILFVDAPVGTGFSYATNPKEYPTSDTKSAAQIYEFLRKWLIDHPQYLKVQLIIGANSYSGITAPIVVQHIVDGNAAGLQPYLNIKGYILGCPRTDATNDENSKIKFSHRMGLISDELYQATKESCGGTYVDVNPTNAQCFQNLKLVSKCIKDVYKYNILEPKCLWASPEPIPDSNRRSAKENSGDFIFSPSKIPGEAWCRNFNYSLSYVWANDKGVQDALHIRPGWVQDWKRCNKSLAYIKDVESVIDVHRYLSTKGLQALVYNGDHDLTVTNTGVQDWIKVLNLTVDDEWRPWFVDGQTTGYTTKYTNHGYHLIYATMKGAGHTPNEYKRREAYDMFYRWIHHYPL